MAESFEPSNPLRDSRHEAFAKLVAGGLSARDAYVQAGYKPDAKNAGRLARHPKVKARIEFLKRSSATQMVVRVAEAGARRAEAEAERVIADKASREEILEDLRKVARIGLGLEPVTIIRAVKKKIKDEDGGYVETIEAMQVQVTELNLAAVNRALELYGKAIGEPFDGTSQPEVIRGTVMEMTPEERVGYARKIVAEADKAARPAGVAAGAAHAAGAGPGAGRKDMPHGK